MSFSEQTNQELFVWEIPNLENRSRKKEYLPFWDAIVDCYQEEAVGIFLGLGVDPDQKCPIKEQHFTASYCRIGQMLVDHGANINAYYPPAKQTLLQLAIRTGIEPCVHFLLLNGARLEGPEWGKDTSPITLAFVNKGSSSAPDVIHTLFNFGVDPNYHDGKGNNLLHILISYYHNFGDPEEDVAIDIVPSLLNGGVPLDELNNRGYSPLQVAITKKDPDLADYLLERGADANLMCTFKMSPLCAAVTYGSADVVNVLLNHGADINLKN